MRRPVKVTAKEAARLEAIFGAQTVATGPSIESRHDTMTSYREEKKYHPELYGVVPRGLAEASHQRITAGSVCSCGQVVQDRFQWCGLPFMGPCSASDWLCAPCALRFAEDGRRKRKVR